MRVLIIDDEEQIRRLISISLGSKGWEVFEAENGFEGIQAVVGTRPDVVLLDINLPDMDGEKVLRTIRAWSNVPIVVVSVRDSKDDIVALLNAGADDYITKPFFTDELMARLIAVCRRSLAESGKTYRRKGLIINLEQRSVERSGDEIHLTNTEFAVLEALLKHAGKIVTRDSLLKEVWGPGGDTEEGSLRVHIRALRKKLEIDDEHPDLIVTEPGVGYRISLSEG
ncbi:MAG: two-component system OmpR family KDP operon response regulator KdpE [Spirochaetes bacterium]|nr:MAG: two-component system OmpR family KDP operon response regulator KdpE [Spirochaetota bacterium]